MKVFVFRSGGMNRYFNGDNITIAGTVATITGAGAFVAYLNLAPGDSISEQPVSVSPAS